MLMHFCDIFSQNKTFCLRRSWLKWYLLRPKKSSAASAIPVVTQKAALLQRSHQLQWIQWLQRLQRLRRFQKFHQVKHHEKVFFGNVVTTKYPVSKRIWTLRSVLTKLRLRSTTGRRLVGACRLCFNPLTKLIFCAGSFTGQNPH